MPALRDQEKVNYDFFLNLPLPDRTRLAMDVKGIAIPRAALRIFRGLLRLRRDALCQTIDANVRRPPDHRQRHRLLLHLRRQPAFDAVHGQQAPNAARPGPIPYSRTTPNMVLASASRLDKQTEFARELAQKLAPQLGGNLVEELLDAKQDNEAEIDAQRERVCELRLRLQQLTAPEAPILHVLADALVKKSVWIVGGDGWAYDIGFGGLDHVIAMNAKVNILVLDTEVYSNTGGQQSKATPRGASARFAVVRQTHGQKRPGPDRHDLRHRLCGPGRSWLEGLQTVKAFEEAESYPGTSLIIAYSPCIEHGYALGLGLDQQKLAVDTGFWPLYRFDPRRLAAGEPGLKLDSATPKVPLEKFWASERRFQAVAGNDPAQTKATLAAAQEEVLSKFALYERMSTQPVAPATLVQTKLAE